MDIAVIEQGAVAMNEKGKAGSFARAIAFATREARMKVGQAMYATWLANSQFRPIVKDALDTLVPKAARPYVEALVPSSGPVPKAQFIAFCQAVDGAVKAKGKELKGEKAFVYEIIRRVAESASSTQTVEVELRRVA
jgi:hypothetical protein